MNSRYGSLWSKWDLHVYTPCSIVHDYKSSDDVWEKYIYELENKDIKVLGINNYWFIDGYKKVLEYKKKGRLKNIDLILPVIELRLEHLAGNDKINKINYHIIFSDKLSAEEIEEEFINKIDIKNLDHRSLTRNNLILYGKKILYEILKEKIGKTFPLQEGFNNFTVSLDKVNELFSKKLCKGKYLTVIPRSEWNDFRWDGGTYIKKTLINDIDIIFTVSPNIEQFKKSKESLPKQQVNDLLLYCSDSYQFAQNKITNSKELGHCFIWIKAKSTFEDNILFKNNIFCFFGLKTTMAFNPNFTCIIGVRGIGKSTLLNSVEIEQNLNMFDLHINNLQKRKQLYYKLKNLKKEFYNALNIVTILINKIYLAQKEKFQQIQKKYNQNMKSLSISNSFLQTIAYTFTNEPFDILEDNIELLKFESGKESFKTIEYKYGIE